MEETREDQSVCTKGGATKQHMHERDKTRRWAGNLKEQQV
jgi:hypothetical protein